MKAQIDSGDKKAADGTKTTARGLSF